MTSESKNHKENDIDIEQFRLRMLAWYKENARELPWRADFGKTPDVYHEWLSEIMLQQTIVKTVIPYFLKFIARWPTVIDLASAPVEDVMKEWAGLGYYTRARNLHKCAKVIAEEYNGVFPDNEAELVKLPGIGPYTAAAITAIGFQKPAIVMDGNVERVLARLFTVQRPIRESKSELKEHASFFSRGRIDNPGDFAQSMMELGALICTPTSPKCAKCPVRSHCAAFRDGVQDQLPVKAKRKILPVRDGKLYFIQNERGEFLFERRSENRMLGGMLGIPGSNWDRAEATPYNVTNKQLIKEFHVSHTFSHFQLHLKAYIVKEAVETKYALSNGFWYNIKEYSELGLPTLYKKSVKQFLSKYGVN